MAGREARGRPESCGYFGRRSEASEMRGIRAVFGSETGIEMSGSCTAFGADAMVAAPMPALSATRQRARVNIGRRKGGVRGRLARRTIAGTSRSGRGWSGLMGDSRDGTRPRHHSSNPLRFL